MIAVALSGCGGGGADTLERITDSGRITVLTRNNANCFYLYKGEPMGFEFELARAFSAYIGVELETSVVEWNDMFRVVNNGKADLVAAGVTITPARSQVVDFSEPYMTIQQQVIVHRDNGSVREIADLDGLTVHVRENTTYQERLESLNRELDLNIRIALHEDIPTEELIRRVAEQEIDVTVADSNIALLNRRYYPDINVAFPLGEKEHLGWAVRKGDRALLEKISAFLDQARKNGTYDEIYERYYGDAHVFDYVDLKIFHHRVENRLPEFLPIIKSVSKAYDFDWRLIAAVIYQESHFDPEARSPTGVRGLMQVTRVTAAEMGIDNRLDPEQSILAGVKYLKQIHAMWDDLPEEDRMLFTLASYNIGYGHVRDAQRLAEFRGLDPNTWSTVEKTLPLLRMKKYYKSTKHGYARGTEPVRYVERILTYYDILRRKDIPSDFASNRARLPERTGNNVALSSETKQWATAVRYTDDPVESGRRLLDRNNGPKAAATPIDQNVIPQESRL